MEVKGNVQHGRIYSFPDSEIDTMVVLSDHPSQEHVQSLACCAAPDICKMFFISFFMLKVKKPCTKMRHSIHQGAALLHPFQKNVLKAAIGVIQILHCCQKIFTIGPVKSPVDKIPESLNIFFICAHQEFKRSIAH